MTTSLSYAIVPTAKIANNNMLTLINYNKNGLC